MGVAVLEETIRPVLIDVPSAVARARQLASAGTRVVIGIAGAPGAGKSTIAEAVAAALGEDAVVVPMDGFHLTDEELERLGRRQRKGAVDTFDVAGYLSLLRRLREELDTPVYAPAFDRTREVSLAGAIAIRPHHRVVITEGNYLLLDDGRWGEVAELLDESWFVQVDEPDRVDRLVRRHAEHGKEHAEAVRWATSSDQVNADLVATTQARADALVRLHDQAPGAVRDTKEER